MGEGEEVCSFAFADLLNDGFLSLVAGYGNSYTPHSCRGIYIINKTASGFEMYTTDGADNTGAEVADNIRDLGRDGKLEILMDSGLGTITATCSARWTSVFAWDGRD